jgi:hypothetical protein
MVSSKSKKEKSLKKGRGFRGNHGFPLIKLIRKSLLSKIT